jgi:PqqD family protein of HPr-rel-A system
LRREIELRWSATPGLVWTQFDDSDEWVVFNPFSGDIHLLTPAAYELWRLTTASPPRSSAELVNTLAAHAGIDGGADFIASARETLAFMDRAGLVVPSND